MARLWLPLLILLLAACAGPMPSAEQRGQNMDAAASARHWEKLLLPGEGFALTAYAPSPEHRNGVLTIYIEGDGLAWLSRARPSDDPTPNRALGLELALRHPDNAVAYLARPCQNTAPADWGVCREAFWTGRRFSPEVVEASTQAIDVLKRRTGAEKLILVGYSGGGAIAALVTARRRDVVRLITVAGNLDIAAWTALQRVEPLTGSLNPADSWQKLQEIPQLHFVGGKDRVVPPSIAAAYRSRFPVTQQPEVRVEAEFDHACCWAERWAERMRTLLPQ